MLKNKTKIVLLFLLIVFPLMVFSDSYFKSKARIESYEQSIGNKEIRTADGDTIPWDVLDGGGGLMYSAEHIIGGSIGQIAPGVSMTASAILSAGYWAGIDSLPPRADLFIRGDADNNDDMLLTMADALFILKCLYVPGSPCPTCWDAADANDDGIIGMVDGMYILKCLYVPGSPCPSLPFPDCGPDPTPDTLDCEYHPCQDIKTSPGKREVDGEMILGDVIVHDRKVMVPVYLKNDRPLFGFAYTISYDPTVFSFKSAESTDLVTEGFDFFSARPDEQRGTVRVGTVVDMGLKRNLTPGYHEVTHLIFKLKTNKPEETVLKFTDVELVDTEARPLSARTNACMIKIPISIPKVFGLSQNYPNPFKSGTRISYAIPKTSKVELTIYNINGQRVRTLVESEQEPGYYRVEWNGKDAAEAKAASGVYFYRIETADYTAIKKMIFLH